MGYPTTKNLAETAAKLEDNIREKVNALELRRTLLRSEIDNPPEKVGVFYFTDRLEEVRCLTLQIDAIKDLLR